MERNSNNQPAGEPILTVVLRDLMDEVRQARKELAEATQDKDTTHTQISSPFWWRVFQVAVPVLAMLGAALLGFSLKQNDRLTRIEAHMEVFSTSCITRLNRLENRVEHLEQQYNRDNGAGQE